jgi:hypothetical protein
MLRQGFDPWLIVATQYNLQLRCTRCGMCLARFSLVGGHLGGCSWLPHTRHWPMKKAIECCQEVQPCLVVQLHLQDTATFWTGYRHLFGQDTATFLDRIPPPFWTGYRRLLGQDTATFLDRIPPPFWTGYRHLFGQDTATFLDRIPPPFRTGYRHLFGQDTATFLDSSSLSFSYRQQFVVTALGLVHRWFRVFTLTSSTPMGIPHSSLSSRGTLQCRRTSELHNHMHLIDSKSMHLPL